MRIRKFRAPVRPWQSFTGETQRFLMLSILIGIFAGLVVVCFHIGIEFLSWATLGARPGTSVIRTLIAPAAGAVLAVLLVRRGFRAARGSGINDTKSALYIYDGYIPSSAILGKFLACTLTIGTGNSLGPEDPSLHMGAGIASMLGRVFRLTRESMRLIAPVGAAAGIAAAFNTPITAVLFVIEEIVASWNAGVLGSIVLSSVSAVVVSRWFLGDQPLFLVPGFELSHPSELLIYAFIGIAGGLLSVVFVKGIGALRAHLARLPGRTQYLRPLAAGFLVGFAGLWLPQIMGAGYGAVDDALHNRFAWQMLILLGLGKILVTTLCFGAGIPGGMFAPTLFTGAMIGGGIGGLADLYWAFPTGAPSAYVLVGMGTFFAGVFRAPMTSIFMVFEVSASYVIILPVMIANTISYLISRQLQSVPFFAMIAQQEGLDLPSLEQQRETAPLRVEDAMSPPITVLPAETQVRNALEIVRRSGPVLVPAKAGRWALLTGLELEAAIEQQRGHQLLAEALSLDAVPHLHADVSLDSALRLLGVCPVLPVSSRDRPPRLLGVLTMVDVQRVYGIKLVKPEG